MRCAVMSCMTVAAVRSSEIPFGTIQLNPGEVQKISLNKLYEGIEYKINCNVQYVKLPETFETTHIQVYCPITSAVSLSVESINTCSANGNIFWFNAAKSTRLYVGSIKKEQEIKIRSLDYDNAIKVDCVGSVK